MKKFTCLFFTVFTGAMLISADVVAQRFFTDAGENRTLPTSGVRVNTPQKYRASTLNAQALKTYLWSLPSETAVGNRRNQAPVLELPMPDGKMAKFRVWESSIMEPGLAAKFPEIRTFAGQGIDDPHATVRFDYNPYYGFNAQILSPNGNVYIDPYARGDVSSYVSYSTKGYHREVSRVCEIPETSTTAAREQAGPCRGTDLYTYRLALACTGEYAVAVNGPTPTVAGVLAAMTTSVNRVTGVYEQELAVRLVLIANNNLLVYLDGASDPYTNNNGSTMLGQNQTNIDAVIGSANYDIGHVFSTGGGGIAGLGVVCNAASKARGVTGLPNPVGDAFDIDFVAHEMGHQFGAQHTFNSTTGGCSGNRSASAAYEVGSGTTIMGYAGLCGGDDIQPNSDPFFHSISFDQISTFLEGGGTCRVATSTGNTLPVITAMDNNGANIPLNTPFTLTGSATDANGDALSYSWEEWDLGPATTWNGGNANTTSPLFKFRTPKTTGSRTFPDMAVILAGYPANPPAVMGGLKGETLPTQARALKFRFVVRDNRAGGGGVVTGGDGCQTGFTGIFQVNTIAGTGPFVVTAPNGGESWTGGASHTVTWNVAGTDAAPINCANVKISLSTDGGLTYPTVILASTPNDGSETITVPNVVSTTARIKIEAVGNIFFDISDANFSIGAPGGTADGQISAILDPANSSTTSCNTAIVPRVTIRNAGTATLTSATINVRLNGTLVGTQAWTGSLAPLASANVTLTTVPISPIVGANTLKIHTTNPNGSADPNAANDTATSVFTRIAAAALPVSNGFETSLTPTGWSVSNPNADGLFWFRFNPAGGSAGGSVWAAVIDNYNFDVPGTVDDIISPNISTSGLLANDSILINFDLAHKNFPQAGFEDSLKVLVSNNCGATWTVVYSKGDPELATAGSSTGLYNPPAAGDWRNQRISIGNNLFGAGQIQVAVRNVNGFGNTTFIDNINISLKPRKDIQALTIVRPNVTECVATFAPSLTVRNNGGEDVTAFKTGYIIDNGSPVIQTHNILLTAGGGQTTVTFPNVTLTAGTHTIKLFVAEPLSATPGPDGTPSNDTLTRTFTTPVTLANLTEGFEGSTFVPANWFLLNPNNDLTWIRTTPGRNSSFSAFIDNWSTNTTGRLDMMQTPPINTNNADSLVITFDLAHKAYPGAADRLRVLVSNNCGATFTSVYSKAGSSGANALATAGTTEDDYRDPAPSDWRTERIAIDNSLLGPNTIIQFENRSDWGNNVFIDNINMAPKFKRDLEVRNVTPQVYCATNVTPVATIFNRGTETINSYTVAYTLDNGTPVVTSVATAIAPGATANVTLNGSTTTTGGHVIKVYSYSPASASGTGDQYTVNDTISRSLTVVADVTAESLTQSFESTTFPPTGWGVTNNDGSLTWQRAGVGNNSNGSAFVRNYAYVANNEADRLHSPVLSYTGVDSVKLTFDVSAALRLAVGPGVPQDVLTVLATKDCGNTFTTIYQKSGLDLHTLGFDPNYPQTMEFIPGSSFYWRNESIDLTAFGAPNGPLQIVFQNTSNFGNNVYVDNVNLSTKTLPANLKENGYVIYPNPFRDQFSIWHWQQPSNLRYIGVYTSTGQLLWRKEFNGNADKQIMVDLSKHANGVYIVRMGYNGSPDVQERILKY